jgi:hypothetical protein
MRKSSGLLAEYAKRIEKLFVKIDHKVKFPLEVLTAFLLILLLQACSGNGINETPFAIEGDG